MKKIVHIFESVDPVRGREEASDLVSQRKCAFFRADFRWTLTFGGKQMIRNDEVGDGLGGVIGLMADRVVGCVCKK